MTPKHAQLQIFIQGNITGGSKTKKLSRATALVSGHFMKVFFKMTTCPRQPL